MTFIHHYDVIKSISTVLKILCATPILPTLAPNPWHHLIFFTVSIVLSFSECHIVGTIQYVAFSDWLPSLSNMYLSFLHVFLWIDRSFIFSAEQYCIFWM